MVALVAPLFLPTEMLQLALFVLGAVIAVVGLNLLVGTAGQLSLAHPFFLAIGAFGYAYLSGTDERKSGGLAGGLGLPPVVAFVLVLVLAAIVGWVFSPISGRVRGLQLGLATLGLIFLGQHVLLNAVSYTGGYDGRRVAPLTIFGFTFADTNPYLYVMGHEVNGLMRLTYLGLALTCCAILFAYGILRSRVGRALRMMRDSETAAAALGINAARYKASVFALSSTYAAVAGAFLALAFGHLVPSYFGLSLAIDYIAMVVIGGMGSLWGGAAGATFITALPVLLATYGVRWGGLQKLAQMGLEAPIVARLIYGFTLLAVVLFEPEGLAGLAQRITGIFRARVGVRTTPVPDASGEDATTMPLATKETS
jgi:branched-chain amino acid transport system permease protein